MPFDFQTIDSDIVRTNGVTKLVNDSKERIQRNENKLKTRQGEFFINTKYGLDYNLMLSITEKETSDDDKKLAIKEALLQDDEIETIDYVNIVKKEDRKVFIEFKATFKNGESLEGGVEIG